MQMRERDWTSLSVSDNAVMLLCSPAHYTTYYLQCLLRTDTRPCHSCYNRLVACVFISVVCCFIARS